MRLRQAFALIVVLLTALLGTVPANAVGTARVPASLPSHFAFGLAAQPDATGLSGWMADSGIPWDYAYQYLTGGVNTAKGWETWQARAQFPLSYARLAAAHGAIPVFPYYELAQSAGPCLPCNHDQAELANLNSVNTMAAYYRNFTLLMQRLGAGTYDGVSGFGKTAIVLLEPSLSTLVEQALLGRRNCQGFCTGQGNNPALFTAAVASTGVPDVLRFPNTYQGFCWALLHLRDLYAPNVLLAVYVSNYATGVDIGTDPRPQVDATALGNSAGTFTTLSGIAAVPNGVSSFDLVANEVSDRDAGYYATVLQQRTVWWDRENISFPNFHRWESYVHAISTTTGRSVLVWQVPIGNQFFDTENNTPGHYQDNRVEYFFSHIGELAQSGISGVMFGSAVKNSTMQYDARHDGVTNPRPLCSTAGLTVGRICNSARSMLPDDDGGYLRLAAQAYYQDGAYPLR